MGGLQPAVVGEHGHLIAPEIPQTVPRQAQHRQKGRPVQRRRHQQKEHAARQQDFAQSPLHPHPLPRLGQRAVRGNNVPQKQHQQPHRAISGIPFGRYTQPQPHAGDGQRPQQAEKGRVQQIPLPEAQHPVEHQQGEEHGIGINGGNPRLREVHEIEGEQEHRQKRPQAGAGQLFSHVVEKRQHGHPEQGPHKPPAKRVHAEQGDARRDQQLAQGGVGVLVRLGPQQVLVGRAGVVHLVKIHGIVPGGRIRHPLRLVAQGLGPLPAVLDGIGDRLALRIEKAQLADHQVSGIGRNFHIRKVLVIGQILPGIQRVSFGGIPLAPHQSVHRDRQAAVHSSARALPRGIHHQPRQIPHGAGRTGQLQHHRFALLRRPTGNRHLPAAQTPERHAGVQPRNRQHQAPVMPLHPRFLFPPGQLPGQPPLRRRALLLGAFQRHRMPPYKDIHGLIHLQKEQQQLQKREHQQHRIPGIGKSGLVFQHIDQVGRMHAGCPQKGSKQPPVHGRHCRQQQKQQRREQIALMHHHGELIEARQNQGSHRKQRPLLLCPAVYPPSAHRQQHHRAISQHCLPPGGQRAQRRPVHPQQGIQVAGVQTEIGVRAHGLEILPQQGSVIKIPGKRSAEQQQAENRASHPLPQGAPAPLFSHKEQENRCQQQHLGLEQKGKAVHKAAQRVLLPQQQPQRQQHDQQTEAVRLPPYSRVDPHRRTEEIHGHKKQRQPPAGSRRRQRVQHPAAPQVRQNRGQLYHQRVQRRITADTQRTAQSVQRGQDVQIAGRVIEEQAVVIIHVAHSLIAHDHAPCLEGIQVVFIPDGKKAQHHPEEKTRRQQAPENRFLKTNLRLFPGDFPPRKKANDPIQKGRDDSCHIPLLFPLPQCAFSIFRGDFPKKTENSPCSFGTSSLIIVMVGQFGGNVKEKPFPAPCVLEPIMERGLFCGI